MSDTRFKNDSSSLIDLVFTLREELIERIDIGSPLGKSDHATLVIRTKIGKNYRPCLLYNDGFNLSKADFFNMNIELDRLNLDSLFLDPIKFEDDYNNTSLLIECIVKKNSNNY